MAFIDELTLHLSAGAGGDGVVRWRREKFIPLGGPSGGDGGDGGDVYIEAVQNIECLSQYIAHPHFSAGNGMPGMGGKKSGKKGDALTLAVPVGSTITERQTGIVYHLDTVGQKVLVLRGGAGGLGNDHFKSSINVTPERATPGKKGDSGIFDITVELIADIGFIGLPNAGKSSLLNAVTHAQAKVGNYAFTTLEPNLGAFYGYVLADIPGLIEGASDGKGLGHKFLKHIRRTRMLAHLISLENDSLEQIYQTVRTELGKFDASLLEKPELVILTKSDLVDASVVTAAKKQFPDALVLSLYDDEQIKVCVDTLVRFLRSQ